MLVIACGALAHEITALRRANAWDQLDVRCLPAELHNRPEKIPAAVRALIRASRDHYRSIFVAYGDCGTGGMLDEVLREEGVERIPGAHCYEFFATAPGIRRACRGRAGHVLSHGFSAAAFRAAGDSRSRARSASGAVPESTSATTASSSTWRRRRKPQSEEQARAIAARMGLEFEYRRTGYGTLATTLGGCGASASAMRSEVVAWHR